MTKQTKLEQKDIDKILNNAKFEEHIFWGKDLIVSYRLPNGFSVIGRAACVDPKNFDIEIGRDIARKDAENKVWELEGYLLQNSLNNEL